MTSALPHLVRCAAVRRDLGRYFRSVPLRDVIGSR